MKRNIVTKTISNVSSPTLVKILDEKDTINEFKKLLIKSKSDFGIDFQLINISEIENCILNSPDLIELIEKTNPLLNKYFNGHEFILEYWIDPEFSSFNRLMIKIKSFNRFDKEWVNLLKLRNEIKNLKILNSGVKNLFYVDLW